MKELEKLEEKYEALGREIEALKNKDERPITWLEFCCDDDLCEKHMTAAERMEGFRGVWRKNHPKYEALRKLELLCKAWGGGYGREYSINNISSGFNTDWTPSRTYLISFENREDGDLFLETFTDLFEEAKELL